MSAKKLLAAAAFVLLAVAPVAAEAGRDLSGQSIAVAVAGDGECLTGSGVRDVIVGQQFDKYRPGSSDPDVSVFDASQATWNGLTAGGDAIAWPVTIRGFYSDGCWYGGTIRGSWNETAPGVTWEDPFHHAGAMTIEVPDFLVEGVRIENHGDGIRPYAPNNRIRGVYLTDIHDDCIENDDVHSLVVEDSFLDGCYVAFSARSHSGATTNGSGNVWQIRDSLVRLEPQPTVYKPEKYGEGPGHGGFFKWAGTGASPRVALHNTILRADQDARHGTLGIPDGLTFESCSNNTIVWLGDGPFPGADSLPEGCFTVTTDAGVWDRAAADWYTSHPTAA